MQVVECFSAVLTEVFVDWHGKTPLKGDDFSSELSSFMFVKLPGIPSIVPEHITGWSKGSDRMNVGQSQINREGSVFLAECLAAFQCIMRRAKHFADSEIQSANQQRQQDDRGACQGCQHGIVKFFSEEGGSIGGNQNNDQNPGIKREGRQEFPQPDGFFFQQEAQDRGSEQR